MPKGLPPGNVPSYGIGEEPAYLLTHTRTREVHKIYSLRQLTDLMKALVQADASATFELFVNHATPAPSRTPTPAPTPTFSPVQEAHDAEAPGQHSVQQR